MKQEDSMNIITMDFKVVFLRLHILYIKKDISGTIKI